MFTASCRATVMIKGTLEGKGSKTGVQRASILCSINNGFPGQWHHLRLRSHSLIPRPMPPSSSPHSLTPHSQAKLRWIPVCSSPNSSSLPPTLPPLSLLYKPHSPHPSLPHQYPSHPHHQPLPISMAIPPPPLLLRLLLALAAILSFSFPAAIAVDLRILHAFNRFSHLHHPDPFSPSSFEATLLSLTSSDESRLLALAATTTSHARRQKAPPGAPIASGRLLLQTPTYVVRAGVGTPPQALLLAVDTSNDAAWIPCTACAGCPSSSPSFSPAISSTFQPLPCGTPLCSQVPNPSCPSATDGGAACSFNLTYGSSSFQATLVQDSLSLAADVISGYTFGCLQTVTGSSLPPQGLLSLGRGPASLPSQTRPRYAATFSYCLPSFGSLNFSGSLRLGPAANPRRIHSTPLLANPRRPSLYYVNMTGIRVSGRPVRIPPEAFAFDPTTGGGTIIDSGTIFTRLVTPAYESVRDEFRRRFKGGGAVTFLGGFDTCYSGAAVKVPAVELEFEGMRVPLPEENVVIRSSSGNTLCLAMAASPGNVNSVLNVVASMAQQNHRVVFDGAGGRLGIARERCT